VSIIQSHTKYAQIKIKTSNTSEARKRTETQARTLRIKNEIKTLYKEKLHLNKHSIHYILAMRTHGVTPGTSYHITLQTQ
jgi:hypothetical protein